jgi:hypothetical protein
MVTLMQDRHLGTFVGLSGDMSGISLWLAGPPNHGDVTALLS